MILNTLCHKIVNNCFYNWLKIILLFKINLINKYKFENSKKNFGINEKKKY